MLVSITRVARRFARHLPPSARAAGTRLLRRAPWPEAVRDALREAARASLVPLDAGVLPSGPASPLGHPAAPEDAEFAAWAARQASPEALAAEAPRRLAALRSRPLISILMPVHDPEPDLLAQALRSVDAQLYPAWELCLADDGSRDPRVRALLEAHASTHKDRVRLVRLDQSGHIARATNAALALASGPFLGFLDHDDELTPDALLEVAAVLADDPAADIVYSDHDVLGPDGLLRHPHFKPDWCPDLLLSYMYVGHFKVYRAALVRELGGMRDGYEGAADYELALRLSERTQAIRHVPRILYHWRAAPRSTALDPRLKPEGFASGRRALGEALRRRGVGAEAEWPDFARRAAIGAFRVRFDSAPDVPVTVIIPTRDRLELLRSCIRSIEERTTHKRFEILVLDNDSREPDTLEYLRRSPHRVVPCPGPFNFAALANRGVREARTEHFVLLNNDTRVSSPDWLGELLGWGRLPGVGAVGAKLLYPDGRIQHAGVLLGIQGLAGHAFQARIDDDARLEYQAYAHVARNYLAVTAACMLSHKTAFEAAGGFNERDLKVGWNDVDYCLRLRERGWRVVFNPYATLEHLESQSRGDDKDPAEVRYMLGRWRTYVERDPLYNPNFSRLDGGFRPQADPHEERRFFYAPAASERAPFTPSPTHRLAAVFEQCGPWQSRFQVEGETIGGPYDFVADNRVTRLTGELDLAGRRVLELGCLEGGHSVALSRLGPRELVSVEGRAASFVRCCVVKNVFGLDNVRFAFDDVRQVTPARYGRFDVVVSMGVLYHLPDPHVLLANLAELTDVVYLSTHYANDRHPENGPQAELDTPLGRRRGRLYQEYGLADPLSGLDQHSFWPYETDLLEMCRASGFVNVKVMARDDAPEGGTASWIELALRK
jgi:GT2 family glycosyltransferase/SAM-dependent methyltransferase